MPPTDRDQIETWKLYEKLIISKLEEHSMAHKHHIDAFTRQTDVLHRLEIELEKVKIRSGLLGFIAGSIPIVAATVYQIIRQ